MKKEELLAAYSNEAGRLGFESTGDEPYLVESAPGEYSRLIQTGFYRKTMVNLVIQEFDDVDIATDELREQEQIAEHYREIRGTLLYEDDLIIAIPEQLHFEVCSRPNVLCRIIARPIGKPMIDMNIFPGCNPAVAELRQTIERVAQLCFDTETFFADAKLKNRIDNQIPAISAAEYFVKRFQYWHQITQTQGDGVYHPWALVAYSREKAVVKFLEGVDFAEFDMQFGFNICGNTDLVVTEAGQHYILDARIEPKPFGFLAAAWLWNYILYGYNCVPAQLWERVKSCINIFEQVYGENHRDSIMCNLFERLYAALEIDLRYRCSPYNQRSDEEFTRGVQNLSHIFNQII